MNTRLIAHPHRLVEEHPDRAVSWFAVGCYYMACQQYEAARRYFGKVGASAPGTFDWHLESDLGTTPALCHRRHRRRRRRCCRYERHQALLGTS